MNLSRRIVALLACGVSACVTQTTVPPRADSGGQPARNVTEFRSKPQQRAASGIERAEGRFEREPRADLSDGADALPPRGDTVAGGSEFSVRSPSRAEPFPIPGLGREETPNVLPADPRGSASRSRRVAGADLPSMDEGGLQRGVPRRPSVRDRDYVEPADLGSTRRGFDSARPLARDDVFAGGEPSAEDLNRAYSRGGYGRDPRWAGATDNDEPTRGFPRPRPSFASNAGDDLPPERTSPVPRGAEFNEQLEQELFGDKEAVAHARAKAMVLAANDPRARAADLPPPEAYAERDSVAPQAWRGAERESVMPRPWRGGDRSSFVSSDNDRDDRTRRDARDAIEQREARRQAAREELRRHEREREAARARLEAREREEEQQAETQRAAARRAEAKREQEQREREEQKAEARRHAEREAQQERQAEARRRQEAELQQAKNDDRRRKQEAEDRERAEEARREQQEAAARRASARAERPAPAPFKRAAEATDQGWHKGEPGRPVPYVDHAKPKAAEVKPATSSRDDAAKALPKPSSPVKKSAEADEAKPKAAPSAMKSDRSPADTVKSVTPSTGLAKPAPEKAERSSKPEAKPTEKAEAKPKQPAAPVVSEGKPASSAPTPSSKSAALPKPAAAQKPTAKQPADGSSDKEKKPKASEATKAKEEAPVPEKKAK